MVAAEDRVRQALRAYIGAAMEIATIENPGPSLLVQFQATRGRCLDLVRAYLVGDVSPDDAAAMRTS